MGAELPPQHLSTIRTKDNSIKTSVILRLLRVDSANQFETVRAKGPSIDSKALQKQGLGTNRTKLPFL